MRRQCPAVKGPWEQLERTKCALRHWSVSLTTFTRAYSWGCSSLKEETKPITQMNSSQVECTPDTCPLLFNYFSNIFIPSPHINCKVNITRFITLWNTWKRFAGEDVWVPRVCCAGLERSNESLQGVCQIEMLQHVNSGSLEVWDIRFGKGFLWSPEATISWGKLAFWTKHCVDRDRKHWVQGKHPERKAEK